MSPKKMVPRLSAGQHTAGDRETTRHEGAPASGSYRSTARDVAVALLVLVAVLAGLHACWAVLVVVSGVTP